MPFILGEMENLKAICFKYLSENLKAKKLFLYGFPIIFRLKGVAPKSDNHAGLLYKKKTKFQFDKTMQKFYINLRSDLYFKIYLGRCSMGLPENRKIMLDFYINIQIVLLLASLRRRPI